MGSCHATGAVKVNSSCDGPDESYIVDRFSTSSRIFGKDFTTILERDGDTAKQSMIENTNVNKIKTGIYID